MAKLRATQKGFTLIELLVVIGIIAVLAAIILPVYSSAQEKGRQANCMSNLHAIVVATKMFRMEEKRYPGPNDQGQGGTGLLALFPDYLDSPKVFACPDDDNVNKATLSTGGYCSYLDSNLLYNYYGMEDDGSGGPSYSVSGPNGYGAVPLQIWQQANLAPAKYPACLNPSAPDNTIVVVCPHHAAFATGTKRVYLVARVGGNADAVKLSQITAANWSTANYWSLQPDF